MVVNFLEDNSYEVCRPSWEKYPGIWCYPKKNASFYLARTGKPDCSCRVGVPSPFCKWSLWPGMLKKEEGEFVVVGIFCRLMI